MPDEKAPERLSEAQRLQVLHQEGKRLLDKIGEKEFVVALCIVGSALSSEQLAERIQEWMVSGISDVTFVIGGSLGLSETVLKRANMRLSFSNMTFSHQIIRVMLMEQIYRAFKIIYHEPYHK